MRVAEICIKHSLGEKVSLQNIKKKKNKMRRKQAQKNFLVKNIAHVKQRYKIVWNLYLLKMLQAWHFTAVQT